MRSRALAATIVLGFFLVSCQRDEQVGPENTPSEDVLTLSFPRVTLQENERIVGLEITVNYGSIKAITNIPEDWSITLTADPQWAPKVSGFAHHGVGTLTDLSQLNSFLVIRAWRGEGYSFNVEARVDTTTDFKNISSRSFSMNDLVLMNINRQSDHR